MSCQIRCQFQLRQSFFIVSNIPNLLDSNINFLPLINYIQNTEPIDNINHCIKFNEMRHYTDKCKKYEPKHVYPNHQMPNETYYHSPMNSIEYLHSTLDHDYARKFLVFGTSWLKTNIYICSLFFFLK